MESDFADDYSTQIRENIISILDEYINYSAGNGIKIHRLGNKIFSNEGRAVSDALTKNIDLIKAGKPYKEKEAVLLKKHEERKKDSIITYKKSSSLVSYCCGFLFNDNMTQVLLIEKAKPDWQKGKLNGIGGKIEIDEFAFEAMDREFKEETFITEDFTWKPFLNLCVPKHNSYVHFFYAVSPEECLTVYNKLYVQNPFESPLTFWVGHLKDLSTIPNLKWIIPLAIDHHSTNYELIEVSEE